MALPGGNTFGYVVRMLTEAQVITLLDVYRFKARYAEPVTETGTESFTDLYSWYLTKSGQNAFVTIAGQSKEVRWLWPLTFKMNNRLIPDGTICETHNGQKWYPFVIIYKL